MFETDAILAAVIGCTCCYCCWFFFSFLLSFLALLDKTSMSLTWTASCNVLCDRKFNLWHQYGLLSIKQCTMITSQRLEIRSLLSWVTSCYRGFGPNTWGIVSVTCRLHGKIKMHEKIFSGRDDVSPIFFKFLANGERQMHEGFKTK